MLRTLHNTQFTQCIYNSKKRSNNFVIRRKSVVKTAASESTYMYISIIEMDPHRVQQIIVFIEEFITVYTSSVLYIYIMS